LIGGARGAKADRIDADRLLRSLMAYLRGEPKVWSVVLVSSVAEEDARRLHRERNRLIEERLQQVNRIEGLCAIRGIYDFRPMRADRLARLEELRTSRASDGGEILQVGAIDVMLRGPLTSAGRSSSMISLTRAMAVRARRGPPRGASRRRRSIARSRSSAPPEAGFGSHPALTLSWDYLRRLLLAPSIK
jgi:transposase